MPANLLANPSFEAYTGSGGVADGWTAAQIGVTAGVAYALVTTGVTDGAQAQQMAYAAHGQDQGGQVTLTQSVPVSDAAYVFSCQVSGSFSGCDAVLTIQGFDSNSNPVSGNPATTSLAGVSGTPQLFTVTFPDLGSIASITAGIAVRGIGWGSGSQFALTADQAYLGLPVPPPDPPPDSPPPDDAGTNHWQVLLPNHFDGANPVANIGQPGFGGGVIGIPGA